MDIPLGFDVPVLSRLRNLRQRRQVVIGRRGRHDQLNIRYQVDILRVDNMGVIPSEGAPIPVYEELLKVPRDVSRSHRLVEEILRLRELRERRSASTLQKGVNGDLVLAVHLALLEHEVDGGNEAPPGPDMLDAVHQFVRGCVRLLLAELVARIPQNHEVRVGLGECIYLDVGDPGEASVGRHVEDQHGLPLELIKGHSLVPIDSCGVEIVDRRVGGIALHS